MDILLWIKVIVVVLLFFGASIFIHEFGHYWVARRRGLKVLEFAIGFGPKICSWKVDGVEWSLRWIPAGGFVKLPQMLTSEALEGDNAAHENLPPVSPLSKILVAVAGPFMNVVFAFAIATVIYFVGLPVLVNPSIIGHVDPKSEEYALGIREGDRIVEVNGRKVTTWQDVGETTILGRVTEMPVVIERNGERKTYQLKTRVSEALKLKVLNLDPKDHPEVIDVTDNSAGKDAGLKAGDIVVSFADLPIASRDQLIELIKGRPEQVTPMIVKRGNERQAITITPRRMPTGEGRIGVTLSSSSVSVYEVMKPGPTPWFQVMDVWDKTVRTLSALFHSKETGVTASQLSGPVGIFAMLGAWVKTDYRLALSFLVLLNVNLAILNMLPIPVLDGGHIVMSIIEAIRGKALSARFVEYTTTAFAVLLISFMLYVSYHDVFERLPLFRALYKTDTQIEPASSPAAP
jgi:regulator of sigma E protease